MKDMREGSCAMCGRDSVLRSEPVLAIPEWGNTRFAAVGGKIGTLALYACSTCGFCEWFVEDPSPWAEDAEPFVRHVSAHKAPPPPAAQAEAAAPAPAEPAAPAPAEMPTPVPPAAPAATEAVATGPVTCVRCGEEVVAADSYKTADGAACARCYYTHYA